MKTSRAFAAACAAALSLTFAACGDDDGDDGGDEGDTTDITAGDTTEPSDDTEPGSDDTEGDGGQGDAPAGEGEDAAADPAVQEDCAQFDELFGEHQPAVFQKQAGDEVTDEDLEELDTFEGELDGLDLQSDGAEQFREDLKGLFEALADADQIDEETMQSVEPSEGGQEFNMACAQAGAGAPGENGAEQPAEQPAQTGTVGAD